MVVLTGAGMSAESGIATFRGAGGLWEGYNITEVASPEGWKKNPQLVLDFYNQRRREVGRCQPNPGHRLLAKWEESFSVQIITQNIDDLHERAGSKNVLHLHGEIIKGRSTLNPDYQINIGYEDILLGDLCPRGNQLRPHIVWFGEAVPEMLPAIEMVKGADILLVVGTSMEVYPAASLVNYAKPNAPIYLVDPNESHIEGPRFKHIVLNASDGLSEMETELKKMGWL